MPKKKEEIVEEIKPKAKDQKVILRLARDKASMEKLADMGYVLIREYDPMVDGLIPRSKRVVHASLPYLMRKFA